MTYTVWLLLLLEQHDYSGRVFIALLIAVISCNASFYTKGLQYPCCCAVKVGGDTSVEYRPAEKMLKNIYKPTSYKEVLKYQYFADFLRATWAYILWTENICSLYLRYIPLKWATPLSLGKIQQGQV